MKNKDKYKLTNIVWQVSKNKKLSSEFRLEFTTKIYLVEDGKKTELATIQGGSHSDLMAWLESEV